VKNDCNYDCNLSNADLLNYVNMVTFKSVKTLILDLKMKWQSKWTSESSFWVIVWSYNTSDMQYGKYVAVIGAWSAL